MPSLSFLFILQFALQNSMTISFYKMYFITLSGRGLVVTPSCRLCHRQLPAPNYASPSEFRAIKFLTILSINDTGSPSSRIKGGSEAPLSSLLYHSMLPLFAELPIR
jgi:hypothetical protein